MVRTCSLPVVMTQVAGWVDLVTHPLLEHLGLGEAAIGLALPDLPAVAEDADCLLYTSRCV